MEDMLIKQKVFDMMTFAYEALTQFPKSEKYALGVDIKRSLDTVLRKCIEGEKKYYKKTTLQELDVEVALLKSYIRLAHSMQFISTKKYEIWSALLVEIGKMVGGWMNSISK